VVDALRPAPPLPNSCALSAALVLLADHELAASTLAARVAASVRADPYAVVGTGLGRYRSGDPRAVVLLGLVRRAAPKSGQLAAALSTPARLRSSTHDAVAVCYRFVT
jgi:citrate synthase